MGPVQCSESCIRWVGILQAKPPNSRPVRSSRHKYQLSSSHSKCPRPMIVFLLRSPSSLRPSPPHSSSPPGGLSPPRPLWHPRQGGTSCPTRALWSSVRPQWMGLSSKSTISCIVNKPTTILTINLCGHRSRSGSRVEWQFFISLYYSISISCLLFLNHGHTHQQIFYLFL